MAAAQARKWEKRNMTRTIILLLIAISTMAHAEDRLDLPDPLTNNNGKTVDSSKAWEQVRRPEILELFRTHVYGRTPATQAKLSFEVFDENPTALGGKALRKQVALVATAAQKSLRMEMLIYLPVSAKQKPVPVLLLLNFSGNHTINPDPAIAISESPSRTKKPLRDTPRGANESRYPVEKILSRGYGIATLYYGDIDPDFHDGFKNGIHPLLDPVEGRAADAWGSVGAWAWGLSRCMDYLETDKNVDRGKVVLLGHSRLGKTSLWAGAQDERFRIVISNNSGCTGAALAKRKQGETLAAINNRFPHWFCGNYKRYNGKEETLPLDQHMLIALMAPRATYVASATKDGWADPKGEFLACVHAEPVYKLFGLSGLNTAVMPQPDQPINDGHIGYHIRSGRHDMTEYDWQRYMDFADGHWKRSTGKDEGKGTLIDVRTQTEYRKGHLKNSINIPHVEIGARIKDHVKDKKEDIVLYCRSGMRAGVARKVLEDMGYENVVNGGSYHLLKEKAAGD